MATLDLEPITRTRSTEAEVNHALTAVALCSGRVTRAQEQLAAQGIHIPERTLRNWVRDTFPNRYQACAEKYAPQIERHMITQLRAGADRGFDISMEAMELERQRVREGTVKDAAASARNTATAAAIMADKMLLLDGRPTSVVESRSMDDIIRGLRATGAIVDSTAKELPEQTNHQSAKQTNYQSA